MFHFYSAASPTTRLAISSCRARCIGSQPLSLPFSSLADSKLTGYELTVEQQRVIESTGDVKVNAVAGSGKTDTLMRYAASRPKDRILYLAFNKSVQKEADKRFKGSLFCGREGAIDVRTAHSLAYQGTKKQFGGKIEVKTFEQHDIKSIVGNHMKGKSLGAAGGFKFCTHVLQFTAFYCNSIEETVGEVDYLSTLNHPHEKEFVSKYLGAITDATMQFLDKMASGSIASTHDYYLKQYQLSNPFLDYDGILFDEGQDASPAMLDVVLKQSATRVIAGDEHQQIYGFRHAANAMQQVDFPSLDLSTSFRFSPSVAKLATHILNAKKHLDPSFRPPVFHGKGGHTDSQGHHAVLGRTNAALLRHVFELLTEASYEGDFYFEGGFNSYGFNGPLLYDVLNLFLGNHDIVRTQMVKAFRDINELHKFAEETENRPLLGFIGIVKDYQGDLPALMDKLKSRVVDSAEKASLILSTVHKAKGMEYDEVTLLSDFCGEGSLRKLAKTGLMSDNARSFYNEETNLVYVAATRTRGIVNIPKSIAPESYKASGDVRIFDDDE